MKCEFIVLPNLIGVPFEMGLIRCLLRWVLALFGIYINLYEVSVDCYSFCVSIILEKRRI
ncbi:hypothetical protein AALP_AA1G174000 [Arabis alpina]|uniref:Uncharacterized protein n=1 Tax=Arabis alpina TaxID=50452 RepID=A0A087HNU6_ARAAL|nr:hypothetical protein AALP_AA1G174000 [Arabis alpina]